MKPYGLALVLTPNHLRSNDSGSTPGKCADLTRFKVPGVAMVISKAATIPASDSTPSYCQADGMIDQRTGAGGKTYAIGFAIALRVKWNDRFLFQGGGGYNGSVRPPLGSAATGDNSGLARGFAVVSTDTGHKGATFDTSYNVDQQASLDFAQVAVARVTELAKQIIASYYGQPARYSYFAGCSTGGREGMLMTQRSGVLRPREGFLSDPAYCDVR
jgi:feruloyl esterase